jgi:indole-3-glycerol phosphate synthase
MSAPRRFSQAISEGDGISLIVEVDRAETARHAEEEGAEALLVYSGNEGKVAEIRDATSLPILFYWHGEKTDALSGVDACIIAVGDLSSGLGSDDLLERAHLSLADEFEIAARVDDEEQLATTLERFDPEIFILAAPAAEGEEALEGVLDLLPDVPAGKLAIAELPASSREDVGALERAGVDGVIVEPRNVADLVGGPPPEV